MIQSRKPLRKHAYLNILNMSPPKTKFSKFSRRDGSNEYILPMFCSKIGKNNVCPCKPHFYYIKAEFKGQNFIGVFS